MKNKVIIFGLMFCLIFSFAFAVVADNSGFESFTDEFESELATFEGKEVPNMLQPFISDETLQIQIVLADGDSLVYHIIVESGIITTAGSGAIEEPGYTIQVSQSFIEENAGEAFGKSLRDGLTTGEVDYEADGFWRKMKLSMMLAAVDIAALFQ